MNTHYNHLLEQSALRDFVHSWDLCVGVSLSFGPGIRGPDRLTPTSDRPK